MPEARRTPKSKYTSDRLLPGSFEGETVTRRRLMGLAVQAGGGIAVATFTLPALGFAVGSALFEAICELPEYYLTRAELALTRRHLRAIARFAGRGCELVEFGSAHRRLGVRQQPPEGGRLGFPAVLFQPVGIDEPWGVVQNDRPVSTCRPQQGRRRRHGSPGRPRAATTRWSR